MGSTLGSPYLGKLPYEPQLLKGGDMSYNLNSLKGVIYGIFPGTTTGLIKGDIRSLDYS